MHATLRYHISFWHRHYITKLHTPLKVLKVMPLLTLKSSFCIDVNAKLSFFAFIRFKIRRNEHGSNEINTEIGAKFQMQDRF